MGPHLETITPLGCERWIVIVRLITGEKAHLVDEGSKI